MFNLGLVLPNGTKVKDICNTSLQESSMLDTYFKQYEDQYQTNKPQKPKVFSTGF